MSFPVSRTGGIYQLMEAVAFLLGLRTPAEWDDFHTPQATHISLGELLTGWMRQQKMKTSWFFAASGIAARSDATPYSRKTIPTYQRQ